MTETEWNSCTDPQLMLTFLRDRGASDRKLRLFACACVARVVELVTTHHLDRAQVEETIRVTERFADQLASGEELRAVRQLAEYALTNTGWAVWASSAVQAAVEMTDTEGNFAWRAAHCAAAAASQGEAYSARRVAAGASKTEWTAASRRGEAKGADAEWHAQAALLRDIFGNPFRVVPFDPTWRSENVLLMAGAMYESRDYSPMPYLADALEESGCDDHDVLHHCRSGGEHQRGCWLLDAVLNLS